MNSADAINIYAKNINTDAGIVVKKNINAAISALPTI
jgi:hypothetical protein